VNSILKPRHAVALVLALFTGATWAATATDDDLFSSTNQLRIEISIPAEGMLALRQSRGRQAVRDKPEAQATIREGGRIYTNVSVQLKGYTTFRAVDSYPSLTLNFDRYSPKQTFHGLKKLSLNNSLQDPARLSEKISRELFAAAGVPVPRADFALVTLNGYKLGLYVLTEGFDKQFLARHFTRADGTLYEGGIMRDIDQPLQIKSDVYATNDPAVRKLIDAAREPNPAKRLRALEAVLDLDRFLSMTAMETILCHSDSYSMNRNNYRLYHDPLTGKFVFIPHGMDRVLGAHRSTLELDIVPPALGLVARAVLSTPEGRVRYLDRAGSLFTNLFQPEALCRRIREIDARILSAKTNGPDAGFDHRLSKGPEDDADNLCGRISMRAAQVRWQLADRSALLTTPPLPQFDSNGIAQLDHWVPKRRLGQPEVQCEPVVRDGKALLHIPGRSSEFTLHLHQKLTLPAGTYAINGAMRVAEGDWVPTHLVRHSPSRYAVDQNQIGSRNVDLNFTIQESRAPDEIELVCHVQVPPSGVWLDVSAVRLRQRQPGHEAAAPVRVIR
jgi:spore coat protein H